MYLSRLHNIIGTKYVSGWGITAQACANMPQASNVNNSELRENATYESILYFTHHKTLKCNLELWKKLDMHILQLK